METKARLTSLQRFFQTNKTILTLEIESQPEIDNLVDKDVRLEIKLWRERRSKAANDYFHKLCRLLAEKLGTSVQYQKNLMISRYGQYEKTKDGQYQKISILDEIDWLELEWLHLTPTTDTFDFNGQTYRWYFIMRGSSTYDSGEMSRLISQTADDAKLRGIEPLPPNEIARFIQYWQPQVSSKPESVVSSAE